MAKKVEGYIKLQIPAGKATPAPPVGPALGQHGVNIVQFTKEFNARTADQGDVVIPVVITVYQDRLKCRFSRSSYEHDCRNCKKYGNHSRRLEIRCAALKLRIKKWEGWLPDITTGGILE